MSGKKLSAWAMQKFFQVADNMILPSPDWPDGEMPLIRHTPMLSDDSCEWWSEMAYLDALADEIEDRCIDNGVVLADFPPVESQEFWRHFGEWPEDVAALLLVLWRDEIDGTKAA